MYGSYQIKEINQYASTTPEVVLEVDGVDALPAALKRLAEMGHDMRPALKALQIACEEQDKQRTLKAAINALVKPTE